MTPFYYITNVFTMGNIFNNVLNVAVRLKLLISSEFLNIAYLGTVYAAVEDELFKLLCRNA